jgi:mRNA interferase RelE/StbE
VSSFRAEIPLRVAETIRSLHPDLKRSIKSAIRAIAADPECGEPLLRELDGLWKFRVRRFRIVYAIDRKARTIRLMAVGHRQSIYEELTARLRKKD